MKENDCTIQRYLLSKGTKTPRTITQHSLSNGIGLNASDFFEKQLKQPETEQQLSRGNL